MLKKCINYVDNVLKERVRHIVAMYFFCYGSCVGFRRILDIR